MRGELTVGIDDLRLLNLSTCNRRGRWGWKANNGTCWQSPPLFGEKKRLVPMWQRGKRPTGLRDLAQTI